jgi:hypothetical protein
LLRVHSNENFAVKDGARFAVENAFVKLVACAVRHAVVNYGMRVRVLACGDEIQSVNGALRSFSIELNEYVMPRKLCAERNRRRIETTVAP